MLAELELMILVQERDVESRVGIETDDEWQLNGGLLREEFYPLGRACGVAGAQMLGVFL